MTENKARKLNVENIITFVLVFVAITLGAHLTGFIKFDIAGPLAGLAFVGFLVFIGYLIHKSGLGRYFKKIVQDTPAPERFSMEEAEQFYHRLLQKPFLAPAETDWVSQYLPVRAQYFPSKEPVEPAGPVKEPTMPVEPIELVELVEPIGTAELVDPAAPIEPKKSIIDRLKEKDKSTTQSLADLGF